MLRHVILWKIKEEKSEAEKKEIREGVKKGLEGLADKIPGLVEIKVHTEGLSTSNADLMLDSLFESEEALEVYAKHPEHVAVANNNVRPYMEVRMCMDYIV
ncbi:MAG: Dabb family protein [Lachnospiraceae bacterium]|nr:Dabb family protein [Lachnospiraceae bacterium]